MLTYQPILLGGNERLSPFCMVLDFIQSANSVRRSCKEGFFIGGNVMNKRIDLSMIGRRYGKLVVHSYSHSNDAAYWNCVCDCGGKSVVKTGSLNHGENKSCGCGSIEQARKNCDTAREKKAVPYPYPRKLKDLYGNMKKRCYDKNNKRWGSYGGRGIYVCEEWLNDIRAFYKLASENGYHPSLQIDRIDVNGNYEPANCRFVDAFVQMNNTTRNHYLEWNGKRQSISLWSRETGIPPKALRERIHEGWPVERALTQPTRKRHAIH